jgi:hypothetical protein
MHEMQRFRVTRQGNLNLVKLYAVAIAGKKGDACTGKIHLPTPGDCHDEHFQQ